MVNIKYFKYKNTNSFAIFLRGYGYSIDDIDGFSIAFKKQYHGNVLKTYIIYFKDDNLKCFKTAYFKSYSEYNRSALGLNGNTLLGWYNDANVCKYK